MNNEKILNGYYKAKDIKTGEEWVVYTIHFGGFPEPKISTIYVLATDHSGYELKSIDEVDIIFCELKQLK